MHTCDALLITHQIGRLVWVIKRGQLCFCISQMIARWRDLCFGVPLLWRPLLLHICRMLRLSLDQQKS